MQFHYYIYFQTYSFFHLSPCAIFCFSCFHFPLFNKFYHFRIFRLTFSRPLLSFHTRSIKKELFLKSLFQLHEENEAQPNFLKLYFPRQNLYVELFTSWKLECYNMKKFFFKLGQVIDILYFWWPPFSLCYYSWKFGLKMSNIRISQTLQTLVCNLEKFFAYLESFLACFDARSCYFTIEDNIP